MSHPWWAQLFQCQCGLSLRSRPSWSWCSASRDDARSGARGERDVNGHQWKLLDWGGVSVLYTVCRLIHSWMVRTCEDKHIPELRQFSGNYVFSGPLKTYIYVTDNIRKLSGSETVRQWAPATFAPMHWVFNSGLRRSEHFNVSAWRRSYAERKVPGFDRTPAY